MKGDETSLAKPPMNCRIAKLLGRRTTPIKSTATMAYTLVVQPTERMNQVHYINLIYKHSKLNLSLLQAIDYTTSLSTPNICPTNVRHHDVQLTPIS